MCVCVHLCRNMPRDLRFSWQKIKIVSDPANSTKLQSVLEAALYKNLTDVCRAVLAKDPSQITTISKCGPWLLYLFVRVFG